ncbi:hypothetical protein BKG68_06500 [Mycobacteroides saopaulense]|uniref:Secreted peptide n=1 Tax=Mycobacteroides saopaulense TaxID=1578165 RepID=A0ABX3BUB7_9MYCO|nr:hypothetical protein BKG68_06500 [Mycobacteroides saopaulense]OHU06018.1 hypothetical protein BKG73_20645 [Mycobacteroides saopaulense]
MLIILVGLLSLRRRLARLLILRTLLRLALVALLGLLVIGVGLTGPLGIPRRGGVVGGLTAVRGLIPALLRLLPTLLAGGLLRRTLGASVVNRCRAVLIQRRLVTALIVRELPRH